MPRFLLAYSQSEVFSAKAKEPAVQKSAGVAGSAEMAELLDDRRFLRSATRGVKACAPKRHKAKMNTWRTIFEV
jgi:hypothetical protein